MLGTEPGYSASPTKALITGPSLQTSRLPSWSLTSSKGKPSLGTYVPSTPASGMEAAMGKTHGSGASDKLFQLQRVALGCHICLSLNFPSQANENRIFINKKIVSNRIHVRGFHSSEPDNNTSCTAST